MERSRAESDYRAAQSKRAAAEGRIAQARERLKAVVKERDEAGNRAADALRETSRNSPLKDTFWEKVNLDLLPERGLRSTSSRFSRT